MRNTGGQPPKADDGHSKWLASLSQAERVREFGSMHSSPQVHAGTNVMFHPQDYSPSIDGYTDDASVEMDSADSGRKR